MFIAVMGVNHRGAPVNIRERMAFSESRIKDAFAELLAYPGVSGCCIVSTCNRTEIYIAATQWEMGREALWAFWADHSGLDVTEISRYTFCHTLEKAVSHLFRVTSGLDSMVLGETEILGQVKRAYRMAHEAGATNAPLNTLFQQALSIGKRARAETGIDRNPVSIPYIAVELIKQELGSLTGRSVLVIGAGKMSEMALVHLKANGISGIVVSNRSYARAVEMAQALGGQAIKFDGIMDALAEADIVISGTAAQHSVLSAETVARAMLRRPERPLLLVDIAVPRDIEPEVRRISGVTLFDVDDLQNVVDRCWLERQQAACIGEKIVEKECGLFMERLAMSTANPTMKALQGLGEGIKDQELKRALSKLGNLSDKERTVVETLASSIAHKIIRQPLLMVKQMALSADGHCYTQMTRKLFGLEELTEDCTRTTIHRLEKGIAGVANEKELCDREPEESIGSVANKLGYRALV
ncbi:MAG: glutamyl-tRNA reductase [Peptococcaceae bacterium]|nr:glutamyl-tRNA reductase [Peptococcaceae bacterium]